MNVRFTYCLKNILRTLIIISGFGYYGSVTAHHVLGGEITYTNITNKKYKFSAHIYRNCAANCEFNTQDCPNITELEVYVSPDELGFAKKMGVIALSKVSRKDVTLLCKTASSNCTGGSYGSGIEEWIYEGYYDFDTIQEYCKFEVGIRVESRLDAYSQNINETFYNFARVNTCNYIKNKSPEFQSPAFYVLPLNQSFTYNILAKDPDGDSLSYSFKKALKGWGTGITYGSGYGSGYPIDVYCQTNCDLNKSSWPVSGIGIDANSGWMGFTPTTDHQTGFIVIEVTEWRKINGTYTNVGVTRRDLQVVVADAFNNVPKITTSSLEYYACADQTFALDFSILDQVYSLTKDSVSIQVISDFDNPVVSKVGSSKNQFDALFTCKINKNQVRNEPYFITIIATDNHCPLMARTYKTVQVKVTGVPDPVSQVSFRECNKIDYTTQASSQDYTHSWYIFNGSQLLESKQGASGTFEVPAPGKFYIRHQVHNTVTGCETETLDSVDVPYFSLMKTAFEWPDQVCKNEIRTLKPNFSGGSASFNFWWNGVLGPDSLNIIIDNTTHFDLSVKDKNGCRYFYSKDIKVFNPVKITTRDTAMCLPSDPYLVSLNKRVVILPAGIESNYQFKYSGNGKISNKGNQFYFEPVTPGSNAFDFLYTDANGCHYQAAFNIKVVDPVSTGIHTPPNACSNDGELDLNKITGCVLSGGIWKSNKAPAAVNSPILNTTISGSGIFDLIYAKDLDGCLIHDTTKIEIFKAPNVYIVKPVDSVYCSTAGNLTLGAFPAGGQWSNNVNAPLPNLFSPSDIASKSFQYVKFTYSYTDKINGCKSSDFIVLKVNKAPAMTVLPGYDVCAGSILKIDPAPKNITKLELTGDTRYFDIQRLNESFIFKSSETDRNVYAHLELLAKALPSCADKIQTFDILIKPLPKVSITAKPIQGCAPFYSLLKIENQRPLATADKLFWREGNNWVAGADWKAINHDQGGVYDYEVKPVRNGCEGEVARSTVTVFDPPAAAFVTNPANRVITTDFSSMNFTDVSTSSRPYTRTWIFEKGSPSTSDKASLNVDFPQDTGLYGVKLSVISDQGCLSEITKNIRVRSGLRFYVPNAFTPDNKGPNQNETFNVVMDSTVQFHLVVRNRWGQIMFETDRQFEGWNGTYLGEKAPAGVYVWVLEANTVFGNFVERRGTVTLIR